MAVLFHEARQLAYAHMVGPALAMTPGPLRGLLVVAIPAAMGALLAWALPRFAPSSGGGLALVRGAYETDVERLGPRTLAGTFVANALSLGAGTPLGPEGPTVVLTSGFAVGAARLLRLPPRLLRGMVPVGTAAGIAAIFNAPITGVVFALEEIIGTASRGVLGSALLAAVAAAVVERSVLGGRRLLPAGAATWADTRELVGFALVGIVCGLMAGALARIVPILSKGFAELSRRAGARKNPAVFQCAVAGAAVGLLGIASPDTMGVGYQPISTWLLGGGSASGAGVAWVAKTAGVALALAAPLVGGVFAPALFLGASLGSFTGHLVRLVYPAGGIDPGAWALVGMGAFFAGFLRTPLASILIVFELTGDYGLVLPQMLTVALASAVARRISHDTLVERALDEAGVSHRPPPGDPLLDLRVRDVMSSPPVAPRLGMTLLEAARLAAGTRHPQYPVADEQGRLAGILEADTLDEAARQGALADPVSTRLRPAPIVLYASQRLEEAALQLARAGETRAPVVASADDPKLLGFLSAADLLRVRLLKDQEDREPALVGDG